MKIKISADSTCNLSPELIARYNVVWHVGDGQVHVQQLLVQEVRT